jgi:predicted NBD/HSP70 family sugar kinase
VSVTARGEQVPAAALALLGTRGPLGRAEIARLLGVSAATITQVTRELVERGLVVELDTAPSQGGRPARLLGLSGVQARAIGAKVTNDHVAVVSVGFDGEVRGQATYPFDPARPDALDALGHVLREVVAAEDGPVLGVGIGLPGSVDAQDSGVVTAPTLGWTAVPVGAALRRALGVPVLVENDVNTLAVAERLYGTGRGHRTFLVLTIGRGIGCGLVVDGSICRGAAGGAGEIGHVPVAEDGPVCECGNRACLEAVIGDAALRTRAVERGVIGPDDAVAALAAAADAGDATAREIYREAGALLARTLAGVVHVLDPEVVVLLGEGIGAWPHWERGFEPVFRAHLLPSRRSLPFVVEPWAED